MNAHRIETTVNPDGSLLLKDVPFQPGDHVEVIILERNSIAANLVGNRYSLRGQPLHYEGPFESVAETEWASLQ